MRWIPRGFTKENHRYSAARVPEAHDVQHRSALAARAMTNTALADLKKQAPRSKAQTPIPLEPRPQDGS